MQKRSAGPETDGMRTVPAKRSTLLLLDRVATCIAFLLLAATALSSPILAGIIGMRITGCTSACNASLVGAGGAVIMIGSIGVTVLALAGLLVLPRPDRFLWWLPCSALAVAAAILLIGNHLVDLGAGA
jgi:hypothetical protein